MTVHDFWQTAGLALVERQADGWLAPTDDYLRAYLLRPEIRPVETSCPDELTLHQALLAAPRMAVDEVDLSRLDDADAADNYRALLAFRGTLLASGTLEGAYLTLARAQDVAVPPVFLDQLAHLILRNALRDVTDPMQLRAAELFFRTQSVALQDGRVLLADEDTVEMRSRAAGSSGLAQLLTETGTPMRKVTLDVLDADKATLYWKRSDSFDTVIDFRFGLPAPDAFARVVEQWLGHLLSIKVRVAPLAQIQDDDWRWHIGMDRESNAILNALYRGENVAVDVLRRIVGLFRMQLAPELPVLDRVRGAPIYLGLAMSEGNKLRMKPQNLIANLPLKDTL
ncbi:MAG: DUF6352 family protein [Hyphomicrobiaceae bacterium]